MRAPHPYLLLTYIGMILGGAMLYGHYNPKPQEQPRTFEVMPSDNKEFTVQCYKNSIKIFQWDSLILTTTDTLLVIQEVTKHHQGNGITFRMGECYDSDERCIWASKIFYQLLEGAECEQNYLTLY